MGRFGEGAHQREKENESEKNVEIPWRAFVNIGVVCKTSSSSSNINMGPASPASPNLVERELLCLLVCRSLAALTPGNVSCALTCYIGLTTQVKYINTLSLESYCRVGCKIVGGGVVM